MLLDHVLPSSERILDRYLNCSVGVIHFIENGAANGNEVSCADRTVRWHSHVTHIGLGINTCHHIVKVRRIPLFAFLGVQHQLNELCYGCVRNESNSCARQGNAGGVCVYVCQSSKNGKKKKKKRSTKGEQTRTHYHGALLVSAGHTLNVAPVHVQHTNTQSSEPTFS